MKRSLGISFVYCKPIFIKTVYEPVYRNGFTRGLNRITECTRDVHKNMQNRNQQRSVTVDRLHLNNKKNSVLYHTTRKMFFCCRLMGLLPLSGLMNTTSGKLRFTFWSPYTIWYGLSLFGQTSMALTTCNYLIQKGSSLPNISNAIFYTSGLISLLVFAYIGRCWPMFMDKVEKLENNLPPFNRNIGTTITAVTVLIMAAAALEYILEFYYGIAVSYACGSDYNVKSYYKYNVPWIFDYTQFSLWVALLSEIWTIQATFLWSFNDVLVIVMSIYLTEHFVVHIDLLKKAIQQESFSCVEFRTQYLKIVRFVRLVNRQFGIHLLTSTASNLYWICVQLFYTLNSPETEHYVLCNSNYSEDPKLVDDDGTHNVYFAYSVSFLTIRVFLVLVLAARIHSKSLAPVYILHNLPSSKYSVEVKRYITQIKNIKTSMTCLDFFHVRRTMILTLFASIVTYELVLLQFKI